MRITKSFVDQIVPPSLRENGKSKQAFYRDSAITGFGLRVTSGGVKSFIVEKRIQGKVKRVTLGKYGNLTVEQAREEAMRFLDGVASGKSLITEKHSRRIGKVTLLEAFEDYLLTRKDLKPSTIHDYRRSIDGAFVHWQNKPLTEITKDMVQLRHSALGKRSKARANNAMRVLRAVFNHAISNYEDSHGKQVILNNPVDRLSQMHAWYKVGRRQTLIKPDELPDWFAATMQLNNETTRHYLYLLLFTGLRRSEASRLQWDDIDFEDRTLTINETMNHLVYALPLSDFLYELLKKRKATQQSPYVFPSDSERGYLVEPRTAVKRLSELSGLTFTLHDLRRTFISIAESLDIPGYALKRLLNHKEPNDITASHLDSNVDLLREPMQLITDFIIKHSNKR
ncbi:MAG: integrase family protein [Gammaproteobacteria bacterium]|nr:integrase family protein [Gammaproteobacteria bacterium]